jgi:hypothetical protein
MYRLITARALKIQDRDLADEEKLESMVKTNADLNEDQQAVYNHMQTVQVIDNRQIALEKERRTKGGALISRVEIMDAVTKDQPKRYVHHLGDHSAACFALLFLFF